MKNNIRMIRRMSGVTQVELADAVGVSQCTVSAWERGVNDISLYDACKVADALDCSIDDLVRDNVEFVMVKI